MRALKVFDQCYKLIAYVVITPYYPKGDLVGYLKRLPRNIPIDAVKMMLDIAEGMKYLHSKNILHGDLKASRFNALLTTF